MDKIKEIWSNWKGSIGFVGGMLVVSTTYFTCTVDPNEEAIKDAALEAVVPEEASEEAPAPKEEPKEKEQVEEEPAPSDAE